MSLENKVVSANRLDPYLVLHRFFDKNWPQSTHLSDKELIEKINHLPVETLWERRGYMGIPPGVKDAYTFLNSHTLRLLKSWSGADLCAVADRHAVHKAVMDKTLALKYSPDPISLTGHLLALIHCKASHCLDQMPTEWQHQALASKLPQFNWWESTFATVEFMSQPSFRQWLKNVYQTEPIPLNKISYTNKNLTEAMHGFFHQWLYPQRDGNFLCQYLIEGLGREQFFSAGGNKSDFVFSGRPKDQLGYLVECLSALPKLHQQTHLMRLLAAPSLSAQQEQYRFNFILVLMEKNLDRSVVNTNENPQSVIRSVSEGIKSNTLIDLGEPSEKNLLESVRFLALKMQKKSDANSEANLLLSLCEKIQLQNALLQVANSSSPLAPGSIGAEPGHKSLRI